MQLERRYTSRLYLTPGLFRRTGWKGREILLYDSSAEHRQRVSYSCLYIWRSLIIHIHHHRVPLRDSLDDDLCNNKKIGIASICRICMSMYVKKNNIQWHDLTTDSWIRIYQILWYIYMYEMGATPSKKRGTPTYISYIFLWSSSMSYTPLLITLNSWIISEWYTPPSASKSLRGYTPHCPDHPPEAETGRI